MKIHHIYQYVNKFHLNEDVDIMHLREDLRMTDQSYEDASAVQPRVQKLILEEIEKLPKCNELGQKGRLPFSYWFALFKIINFQNVRETNSYIHDQNKLERRTILKMGKEDDYLAIIDKHDNLSKQRLSKVNQFIFENAKCPLQQFGMSHEHYLQNPPGGNKEEF